jgi:transcriptional regulator with XRE-family HTH domain
MPQPSRSELPPVNIGGETFGQRLERFRKEKGYTQKELAQKIGISQVLISKYEKGTLSLSAEMLFRFAKALNISSDKILGLEGSDSKEKAPSLRIIKRVRKIEKLPPSQQKAILHTLDLAIDSAGKKLLKWIDKLPAAFQPCPADQSHQ